MASMAEKTVRDNSDLMRHIYSFGTPQHRTFTYHLTFDLKAYPELLREKYSTTCLNGHVSYCMNDYLYQFSTSRLERYLNNFKRCYCCNRHSIEKPMMIQKKIVNTGPSVFENQESDCDCDCCCRSLSRIITRNIKERYLM